MKASVWLANMSPNLDSASNLNYSVTSMSLMSVLFLFWELYKLDQLVLLFTLVVFDLSCFYSGQQAWNLKLSPTILLKACSNITHFKYNRYRYMFGVN